MHVSGSKNNSGRADERLFQFVHPNTRPKHCSSALWGLQLLTCLTSQRPVLKARVPGVLSYCRADISRQPYHLDSFPYNI